MLKLLTLSLLWIIAIYMINCVIAQRILKPAPKELAIYIPTMTSLGLVGEVGFDTCYKALFGRPLWEYHLLPIHNGYTSVYSLFLWSLVGLHLCLLHSTLKTKGLTSVHALAWLFCAEAIVLEALVNISHLAAFGTYIYYYLPTDVWHITSLQTLPLYLLAGYITVTALVYARHLPRLALAGNTLVAAFLVVFK